MSVRLDGAFVLHERAREHHYSGPGTYSIKWFPRGSARYRVGRATYVVDASSFLVLNDGEEYAIDVEDDAESLCVFFDRAPAFEFAARTHSLSSALTLLARLRATPSEEILLDLEDVLAGLHGHEQRQIESIDAVRASTRREIYRRAHVARDFINASLSDSVSLADIANVAAMSPNQLLRTFRGVFGRSPHQYVIELRLERAKAMLARGTSVTETCFACGFESLGSFSALFRRRFGVPPSAYRRGHVE